MANATDKARRRWGVIYLALALVLLILGQTTLKPWLGQGWLFVVYWLACIGLTLLAMLIALLDAWIIRTRARRQQNTLIKGTLQDGRSTQDDEEEQG